MDDPNLAGVNFDQPISPDNADEMQEILQRIKDQMASMSDEDRAELKDGFVGKLADKVRAAGQGQVERGVAGAEQGLLLLVAVLVLFAIFGAIGYTIYQYVNKQERKKASVSKAGKSKKEEKKQRKAK
ncbi:uncharacterized protein LOC132194186 [Neocloeon triangulifer]|uniref:uncharacterized protein LOC132194186 n=1 Tax=Neocloeon triangulifer TaxID=2078957 RepID=UPI00286EDF25|nr:uncharacterized protein LOC132194186 [Neocloeon triangulifer]